VASASPDASGPFWRRLYRGWLEVAARFGEIQTLVIVTLSYLLAIGPMAVGAAVARRDLLDKRALRRDGSAWADADSVVAPDRERARRMF
jgi:hypothetical protein